MLAADGPEHALEIERLVHDGRGALARPGSVHRHPPRPMARGRRPRPRRHGHRLPGRARRRPVRAACRAEAGERPGAPGRPPPLHGREPHPRPPLASQHRPPDRCRPHTGGLGVPGDGVRRRLADHGVRRRAPVDRRRSPASLPRRLRGHAARASGARRPPGPEALEHPGVARRRGEAARLRHRQAAGAGSSARRSDQARAARADARLRRSRTAPRRAGQRGRRRLRARRGAVRAADRAASGWAGCGHERSA